MVFLLFMFIIIVSCDSFAAHCISPSTAHVQRGAAQYRGNDKRFAAAPSLERVVGRGVN